jgi:peptidoglycan/xylan/chitin deacetylase (PgdA/CDA1 family)
VQQPATRGGVGVFPPRLVVLMYHGLHHDAHDEGHFDPRYSVHPASFEAQMQRVRAKRGHAWLPDDAMAGVQSPEIMVSFDDGEASDAEVALPILLRLGLRATFFVTSGFVGRRGSMSATQLRAVSDAGMVIGSHGASHRFLNTLSAQALRAELAESRELLQDHIGRRVDTLALPGGRGGERELQTAYDIGYQHVFGSAPGDNREGGRGGYVQRVAITRDTTAETFDQILAWRGPAVRRIALRHRMLQLPKRLIGDTGYQRLRELLLR